MTKQTDDPLFDLPDGGPYTNARVATKYETMAKAGELFPRERRVLDQYFEPDGRVLDLGCGCGRTTRALAHRGFDVVGVDVSEAMVERGRRLFDDLDIRLGNAVDLEFADRSFEYVLFSYVGLDSIRPESNRDRALSEINRILDANGTFAFSSHNFLYNLPALLFDRGHLRNFYLENGNRDRVGSRYKADGHEFGVMWYISNPIHQIRQLRRHGFDTVELVGKRGTPGKYFERQPYYVAKKRR